MLQIGICLLTALIAIFRYLVAHALKYLILLFPEIGTSYCFIHEHKDQNYTTKILAMTRKRQRQEENYEK